MIAKVTIALQTTVSKKDREQMLSVAAMLTNHTESISIETNPENQKEVIVEFGIKKARQADVVDPIGKAFTRTVENYNDISISFTNKSPQIQRRFTPKQGQYLAFIHYYTKIHGIAPAEADLQKHFKVTPPSVHSMLNKLEQNGLIKRTPRQARSIELLISRKEIPDLA
jgi:repressor LexA